MFLCIILKCSSLRFQRAQDHRNRSPDEKVIAVFFLLFSGSGKPAHRPVRPAHRPAASGGRPAHRPAQAGSQAGCLGWQAGPQPGFPGNEASPQAGSQAGLTVFSNGQFFEGTYLRGFFPNDSLSSSARKSPPLLTFLSLDFSLFLHDSCLKLEGKREEI